MTGGPIQVIVDMVEEFPTELIKLMTNRETVSAEDLQRAKEQHSRTLDRLSELQDVAMVSTEFFIRKIEDFSIKTELKREARF